MSRRIKGATKWLSIFEDFIKDLRIDSKEETAADDRGTVFNLWGSQKRFLQELALGLEEGVRVFVFLKSRQLGITTVSLAIDLFWLAIHPGIMGALVVDNEGNRDQFRSILTRYLESFPPGYFGNEFRVLKNNRYGIEFSNGSRLVYLVAGSRKTNVNWGEGKGFAFAHLSEVSKYGGAEGLKNFEEALAQKNPNRLVIMESTANGFNHWRDRWMEAKADIHVQRAAFIGWWANPNNNISRADPRYTTYAADYLTGEEKELADAVLRQYGHRVTLEQVAWYRWRQDQAQKSGTDVLDQNQPWVEEQAFIATGFSFFQMRKISGDMQRLAAGGKDEARFRAYNFEVENDFWALRMNEMQSLDDGEVQLRVWHEPVPDGKYVIGADPAYGRNDHKDRHACSVLRCFADKVVQVAEFATSNIEVKQFAWILAFIAGAYSDCIVNLELGGPGRMVMLEWDHILGMLRSEAYAPKVKSWEWDDAMNNARWYLYHRPDQMGPGYAYNFETSWRTQMELMHQFRGAYSTQEFMPRSLPLLSEMQLVIQDGNHIGAPESRNEDSKDDRVFANALAVRAWINWRRPELLALGKMYEDVMREEAGELTPAGKAVRNVVYNFFKRRQEEAESFDPRPTWKIERGLA